MKTLNWLFLDDTMERHAHMVDLMNGTMQSIMLHQAFDTNGAIEALSTNRYDTVWLDHDLEDTDPGNTGVVVAEFIALHQDLKLRPKQVIIHSHNPAGALRMEQILLAAGVNAKRMPFSFV